MVNAISYINKMRNIDEGRAEVFQEQVIYFFDYHEISELKNTDKLPIDFCIKEIHHQVSVIDENIDENVYYSKEDRKQALKKRKSYLAYRDKLLKREVKV